MDQSSGGSMDAQFATKMGSEWSWRSFPEQELRLIAAGLARGSSVVGLSRANGQRLQVNLAGLTLIDAVDGFTQSIRYRPNPALPWKEPHQLVCERQDVSIAGGRLMRSAEAKQVRRSAAQRRNSAEAKPDKPGFGIEPQDANGREMVRWLEALGLSDYLDKLRAAAGQHVEKLAELDPAAVVRTGVPLGVVQMVQQHAQTYLEGPAPEPTQASRPDRPAQPPLALAQVLAQEPPRSSPRARRAAMELREAEPVASTPSRLAEPCPVGQPGRPRAQQGHLMKQGRGFMGFSGAWAKRWFVLDDGTLLCYDSDQVPPGRRQAHWGQSTLKKKFVQPKLLGGEWKWADGPHTGCNRQFSIQATALVSWPRMSWPQVCEVSIKPKPGYDPGDTREVLGPPGSARTYGRCDWRPAARGRRSSGSG